MNKSSIKLRGKFALKVTRKGKVIHRDKGHNLVTSAGEDLCASRLGSAPPAALDWMAFGDSGQAPTKADTALIGSEVEPRENEFAAPSVSAGQLTLTFQLTATGVRTIREIGVFNANAAGTMLSRFLTQEFTMDTSDILDVTWSLQFLGID